MPTGGSGYTAITSDVAITPRSQRAITDPAAIAIACHAVSGGHVAVVHGAALAACPFPLVARQNPDPAATIRRPIPSVAGMSSLPLDYLFVQYRFKSMLFLLQDENNPFSENFQKREQVEKVRAYQRWMLEQQNSQMHGDMRHRMPLQGPRPDHPVLQKGQNLNELY